MHRLVGPSPLGRLVLVKSLIGYKIKGRGQPCKQGEAASRTGCIPDDGKSEGVTPQGQAADEGETKPGKQAADGGEPGSKDNPVRVGDNIKLAARLIAQGKHVRLKQPEQVSTLLDRMDKMIRQAEKYGEKAPSFDLCKISVKGTNLFCQDNIGIPRVKMPQMRGVPMPGTYAATLKVSKAGKVDISKQFVTHLEAKGIEVESTVIRASFLRASQSEIDGARITQLIGETKAGKRDLRERPIFVTRDNYVVDGHHHWAAIVGLGYSKNKDMKIPVYKLNMDIGEALSEANEYARLMGIAPKSVKSLESL